MIDKPFVRKPSPHHRKVGLFHVAFPEKRCSFPGRIRGGREEKDPRRGAVKTVKRVEPPPSQVSRLLESETGLPPVKGGAVDKHPLRLVYSQEPGILVDNGHSSSTILRHPFFPLLLYGSIQYDDRSGR